MIRRPKNVLLIYKKSVYEIYFVQRAKWGNTQKQRVDKTLLRAFEKSHREHYMTLKSAQDTLNELGISFCTADRTRPINYANYDLIITIGGDGTLLNAAGQIKKQIAIGVNSNPDVSIGRFCSATKDDFAIVFKKYLQGHATIRQLNRMNLLINGKDQGMTALNDYLVCHRNPSAMSYYSIVLGKQKAHQRSSGVWIASGAGSTGAIQSAGGKPLSFLSTRLVYRPREVYLGSRKGHGLLGGAFSGESGIKIESKMEEGMIYVDGSRAKLPFCHGDNLWVKNSKYPLSLIDYKSRLGAVHLKRRT